MTLLLDLFHLSVIVAAVAFFFYGVSLSGRRGFQWEMARHDLSELLHGTAEQRHREAMKALDKVRR